MAKLADAPDLRSGIFGCVGSSPTAPIQINMIVIPGYYKIEKISVSLPVAVYALAKMPNDQFGVIIQDDFDIWHVYPYDEFNEIAEMVSAIPPEGADSLREIDDVSILKTFSKFDGPAEGLCFAPGVGFGYFITQHLHVDPRLSIIFPISDEEFIEAKKSRSLEERKSAAPIKHHNEWIKRKPIGHFDHAHIAYRVRSDHASAIEARANKQPDWKKGDIKSN